MVDGALSRLVAPGVRSGMPKTTKSGVGFAELRELLGKSPSEPAFTAVMARVPGRVVTKSDFVIAKEAGFDFALGRPEGAKRNAPKVATTLFIFAEGRDKHRQFADPPSGFAFTTRDQLLASLPAPLHSWKIGKGKVPVETKGVHHDRWLVDGFEVSAEYSDEGIVRGFTATLPEDASVGREIPTHPLHFETKPVDAPVDAELIGMALLVAWAAERFGLPAKHATTAAGAKLKRREITPRAFLIAACGKTLTTADFDPKLESFLFGYTHRMFIGDDNKANKAIAKLLRLSRDDERAYTDDFLGTFAKVVDSPFYVPDSWDAVDRIAPILDARWADFSATGFEGAPQLASYEKAAKLRDERTVVADRAAVEVKGGADAKLAADMLALIGRPLADKAVKAVLERAGLPVGKTIDEQANPALGISYMGAKLVLAGKRVLGVRSVEFHANKQRSYIRGIGGEVEFAGYPAALPFGVAFGESQDAVVGKLGTPERRDAEHVMCRDGKLRIYCRFARGKLVAIDVGLPPE
jgi:hypothetical protein